MNPIIQKHFNDEISNYRQSRTNSDFSSAWNHLERAHILSQKYAWPHIYVHVCMIGYSFAQKRWSELLGQIPRILLAGPESLLGLAPKGNTGGANVGIFTPMQIPDDLQKLLDQAHQSLPGKGL